MMNYYITPLPKTILSAITFPITLPLDRTLYLSYFSRYSRFCYFDHFFGHISGSTGPILLTSKTILSATKFPIMLVIIIFSVSVIFLEIFSKNLSDTSIEPLFDHFFANISGSNEPILLIFELSLTNRSLLKKDSSKSVQIYSSYRDDGQTDRRTDGNFFLHFWLIWV